MLRLKIPGREFYDEMTCEFKSSKPVELQLEHSLVSLSKWESKWHKPFLSKDPKTREESLDYIRCMTINPKDADPLAYEAITDQMMKVVNAYIEDPMTATTFSNQNGAPHSRKIITAEEIYYSMIALDIPFECQKWHLNRLMTLIKVCGIRNTPAKKMSKRELNTRNSQLNSARRAQLKTRG